MVNPFLLGGKIWEGLYITLLSCMYINIILVIIVQE